MTDIEQITVYLPRIVQAEDHRQFDNDARLMTSLKPMAKYGMKPCKIKVDEVGNSGGIYIGVMYAGRKPSKSDIKELLKRNKIELNSTDG